MSDDPTKNSSSTAPTINPEDDVALQAIEALEAQSIDPNPEPFIPVSRPAPMVAPRPTPAPVAPKPKPVEPVKPVVVTPIVPKIPAPVAKPAPTPTVAPAPPKQEVKPKPTAPDVVAPKKPKKPAEAIAEALANAPETVPYRPFVKQKLQAKPFIIGAAVFVVVALFGVGIYIYLQYV